MLYQSCSLSTLVSCRSCTHHTSTGLGQGPCLARLAWLAGWLFPNDWHVLFCSFLMILAHLVLSSKIKEKCKTFMATICLNQKVCPRPSSCQHPGTPPPIQKIIPDIFFFFFFFFNFRFNHVVL